MNNSMFPYSPEPEKEKTPEEIFQLECELSMQKDHSDAIMGILELLPRLQLEKLEELFNYGRELMAEQSFKSSFPVKRRKIQINEIKHVNGQHS